MQFDCCRSAGSTPAPLFSESIDGTIPGSVPGKIPEEYAASQPIYFEGPVSFEDFLKAGNPLTNDLDMSPSVSQDTFMWPVTSRFSFVAAVSLALLAALWLCSQAQAFEGKNSTSFSDSQNVRIAHNTHNTISADTEPSGRIISFVCGRPNTLQVLAPMDLPPAKQVRFLPQGASPIAEMKFMPAPKAACGNNLSQASGQKLDNVSKVSTDRLYNRLLKLSLADPAMYRTEAPSLITYFSILTGGQDQRRVEELEKILERNLRK